MFSTIKSLAKHSFIYGLGDLLSRSVGFLMIPVYTHYLTPDQYGTLELLDLTSYIVGMFLSLLVGSSVVRYYYEYPDEFRKQQVITVSLINVWVVSVVCLSLFYLSSRQMSELVFKTADNYMLFNIIFTSLAINMSNDIPLSLLRIKERSGFFVMISLSRLVVNLSLNILFVVHYGMGVQGILTSGLIASTLSGIFLTIYILRGIRLSYSWEIARAMWHYSAPIVGSMVGMYILNFADRFFLQRLATLGEVGIYSLAYRFGMIPNFIVSGPFLQVWGPKRFEIAKQPNAPKTFGRVFTYFWLMQLWVGLGLCILIKDVIGLIADPEYYTAYKYVPILVLGYMAYGSYSFVQFGILYAKKTKYLAYNTMTVAVASLVSNFFLIKWLGIWGATITTGLSFVVLMLSARYFAQRLYKIPYETSRLVRMNLVAAGLYVLSLFIVIDNAYVSVVVKFLLGFSFPVWLYFIGFYEPEEFTRGKELARTIFAKVTRRDAKIQNANDPSSKEPTWPNT